MKSRRRRASMANGNHSTAHKDAGIIRLGASAALESGATVHTRTFVAAIRAAVALQPPNIRRRVRVIWKSDRMSPLGGRLAGRALVHAGADCVVGHYNSGAAREALAVYRPAELPAFLPTASDDALTALSDRVNAPLLAFRLSAANHQIAAAGYQAVILPMNPRELKVWHDGSRYARSLAAYFDRPALSGTSKSVAGRGESGTDVLHVLLGNFPSVARKIRELRDAGNHEPILILDDAVHPELSEELASRQLDKVFGVTAHYDKAEVMNRRRVQAVAARYGIAVETPYFLETVAAVQAGLAAVAHDRARPADSRKNFMAKGCDTVLGRLRFTENGDNARPLFACWTLVEGAFRPVETFGLAGTG